MHPKLFELGSVPVYSYGVLLAAAFLLGLQVARLRARHAGLDPTRVMDLGIYVIIAGLVGARLLLLVVEFEHFSERPAELLTLARSGGVFYGGLLLAIPVALWYLRRHNMPVWQTCDVFAPGVVIGQIVGRLGCFLAGCCFGRPTTGPWAVTFTDPLAMEQVGTPLHVPLHPAQLYEAGALVVILLMLVAIERRDAPYPGRVFWSYIFLYAVARFGLEFFRGDDRGLVFDVISTSQFLSLLLVPLALLMLRRRSRLRPPAAPARPAGAAGRRR